MGTTTIRLPDELKSRVTRLAQEAGVTTHGFIVEAIEQRAAQAEAQRDESPALRARIAEAGLAVALRNRLIHGYDAADDAIVWDTVTKDLPKLAEALKQELGAG